MSQPPFTINHGLLAVGALQYTIEQIDNLLQEQSLPSATRSSLTEGLRHLQNGQLIIDAAICDWHTAASPSHHLQPSQEPQPSAVGAPMPSAIGGHAAVVVEVYALGQGVTRSERGERQGVELSDAEGVFELDTRDWRFTFDPRAARQTEWLVMPIERQPAAVGQALQAVDQPSVANLGDDTGHALAPQKTVILSLPPGTGKSTIADALAARLGCTHIVDEWHPGLSVSAGALHLTNCEVPL